MPRRHLIALAAAALVTASAPAVASASGESRFRSGTFKVEVEGVQKTTWSTHHEQQFECDANVEGSGTETVRFRSRPVVVTVTQFGDSAPIVLAGRARPVLALRSTITRQGQRTESGAAVCSSGDGTGGVTPPAPDCGTRTSTLWAEVAFDHRRRGRVGLEQSTATPIDPFRACAVGGTSWPALLDRTDDGMVAGQLPARDLFAHGKNITIGRGVDRYLTPDTSATTTVRWSLSFTRVGARRP